MLQNDTLWSPVHLVLGTKLLSVLWWLHAVNIVIAVGLVIKVGLVITVSLVIAVG